MLYLCICPSVMLPKQFTGTPPQYYSPAAYLPDVQASICPVFINLMGASTLGGMADKVCMYREHASLKGLQAATPCPPFLPPPQDDWWRQRWVGAMDDAVERLVRRTPDGSLVWVSDLSSADGSTSSHLEHLVRRHSRGRGPGGVLAACVSCPGVR